MALSRTAGLGRPFWTVWTAATVSTLGDGIRYVAFPLLAASLTRDPRAIALVSAAGYLPWAVFGLLSGAVVDRVDRRRLMYRIDFGRAMLVGGFAVLMAEQQAPVVALALVSFALGSAETLFDNAASAILPMLVPESGLERANSWTMVSQNVMSTLIGAPLGSLLFGLAHEVPMIADAPTFVFAAALVATVRGHYVARTTAATTRVHTDVADGLRWLWRHRLLRTLCTLVAIQNIGLAAGLAVLVLYAYEVLHLSSFGYSLLLAALAVGGVAGAFPAPSLRARVGLVPALTIAATALAGGLALAGATSSVAATAAGLALFGVGISVWSIITASLRQRIVPADLLGRVTSSYRVVGLAAMPVGAAVGGLLAHSFGLHAPYLAEQCLKPVDRVPGWDARVGVPSR